MIVMKIFTVNLKNIINEIYFRIITITTKYIKLKKEEKFMENKFNISKEELENYKNIDFHKLKNMDIMNIKLEDLQDINDVQIDDSLPYELKLLKFIQQIKNPYFFKVGNVIVNSTYNEPKENIYIEDCLNIN